MIMDVTMKYLNTILLPSAYHFNHPTFSHLPAKLSLYRVYSYKMPCYRNHFQVFAFHSTLYLILTSLNT